MMGETGKMAKPCMGLVLVEFGYEYKNQDGCMVSIKPNERYTLLAKTNDHWWHVRKDESTKPFYIPAKYVKELPSSFPSPLDFVDAPAPKPTPPSVSDLVEKTKSNEVTIRARSPGNHRKTENRMSTFGVPLDMHEPPSYMYGGLADPVISLQPVSISEAAKHKRLSLAPNFLLASHEASQKPRAPSLSPAELLLRQAKPVEPPVLKNLIDTRPQGLLIKPEPLIEPEEESSPVQTPSSDSENIYETISDLNLDDLVKTEPAAQHDPPQSPPSSALQGKQERENPNMAVYANVTELKKLANRVPPTSTSTCSSPGLPLSPAPDSPQWEERPGDDQDSGKMFYPAAYPQSPTLPAAMDASALLSPAPSVSAPSSLPPTVSQGSDWEQLVDDNSGRPYYFSATLNQTSWDAPEPISPQPERLPPLPKEDYPKTEQDPLPPVKLPVLPRVTLDPGTPVPTGWSCSTEPGGKAVFTNDHTQQQWIQSKDDTGKTYYYLKDGSVSLWNLPEVSVLGNGSEQEGQSVLKNWRPVPQEDTQKFFPSHRRVASDYSIDSSSTGNSPDLPQEDNLRPRRNLSSTDAHLPHLHHPHHHASMLEKAGILNKTKIADNGKKLRKNWTQSWTVLHGGILTFYKDPKSTPGGNVTKTNQIIPEFTVELKAASVGWASKDKSSKKNVLELKTRQGSDYLIQYDTDSIIHDWHKIIQDTIKHLDHEHYTDEEDDEVMEKSLQPVERERKNTTTRQSSGAADSEQGRVRVKLRKFLQRRPTLQAVKEKGYIKDSVFGCHLDTLCHRENTTVPRFVEKCIKSVERRGLNIDGIYRVSGNLAVIQKLRHRADHEEDLDLDDGQWEEIHVITGALKLFFRELPEPLFPFSFFDKFIAAIRISDPIQRVSYMQDLVRALPLPNHNTMEVLFRHLRKVVEHTDSNRMSFQSMAIVFGPTLLRPEVESGNMAVHMVFQNQIVELILNKYNEVFSAR
ncbi:rho GTPase-activating protein 27 isoform X1 [Ictalurus punctatus]|uniref:Rho GTPase-activating protein 27 n=1 Tax=Ictalurus punctatus TaxID=7998 RepID=W5UKC5_ICTPU|nr:rho GTPase-activating protein 27 isoform X1 [Ictalurus punctatus]XP_047006726.1 rho GTPase-activating protein 27 isoform X1 [Ictalurus punctatus]